MCVCPHPHIDILLLWVWWEHLRSIFLASFKRILHYWSPDSCSLPSGTHSVCFFLWCPDLSLPASLSHSPSAQGRAAWALRVSNGMLPSHSSPHSHIIFIVSVAVGILMPSALPRVLTFPLSSRLIYSIKLLYLHISWVPRIQHSLHTVHILITWYELQPPPPLPVFVTMPSFLCFPDPASWVLAFKSLSFLNSLLKLVTCHIWGFPASCKYFTCISPIPQPRINLNFQLALQCRWPQQTRACPNGCFPGEVWVWNLWHKNQDHAEHPPCQYGCCRGV